MATVTVKNIPDDLYKKLKGMAKTHRRSINNEIIYCIENTITSKKIDPDKFIAKIENFYKDMNIPLLTQDKLNNYKEQGRL